MTGRTKDSTGFRRGPKAWFRYALEWCVSPARMRGRVALPTQLNFPITDNCNARCVMCDVWKEPSEGELEPQTIQTVLSDRLFSKVAHLGLSGGEPSLRRDLIEIVRAVHRALPSLRTLSLTTHGFHTKRWQSLLPELDALCREHGTELRINVSIDGVGPLHDRVRGIPGAFEKALATSRWVQAEGVPLQWQCTVSAINVFGVSQLLREARERGIDLIFRQATAIERLDNHDSVGSAALTVHQESFFADFLTSPALLSATPSPARRLFYRDLAHRLATGAIRRAPCFYQNEGALLTAHGELFHCSLSRERMAHLAGSGGGRLENGTEAYASERTAAIRGRLLRETCGGCRHDQSGAWSPWALGLEVVRARRVGRLLERALEAGRLVRRAVPAVLASYRKAKPSDRPVRRVLLIGAYGGEHVGDAAILGGVARRLADRHDLAGITVASTRPDRTRRWVESLDWPCPVDVVGTDRRSLARAVARVDRVVHAGGPIMDLPGPLVSHLEVASRARILGRRFEIEGSGIGPFKLWPSRFVASRLIQSASRIVLRSRGAASHPLVAGRRVSVDQDPAIDYLADRAVSNRIDPLELAFIESLAETAAPETRTIGLNLRPLWHKYGARREALPGIEATVLDRVAEGLRRAVAESEAPLRFVFFPMNADQYGYCDLDMAWALQARLAHESVDLRVWEAEPGPDGLVELLRGLDGVIAMRFHAVLFAMARGVPVAGLDYAIGAQGKVGELFTERGLPERVQNIASLEPRFIADQVLGFAKRTGTARPPAPRAAPKKPDAVETGAN